MFYIRPESSLSSSSSFSKTTNLNLLWLRLDGELLSLGKYNTQETRKISPSPNLKFRWISDRYIKREKRKKNVLARTIFFWPHSTKNGAERFDICCNKQDKEICVVPLLFIQQRTTQKMYQSMYICIFKHTHVKKYKKRKKNIYNIKLGSFFRFAACAWRAL